MKIGLGLPQLGHEVTPKAVKRFAVDAEATGFDCLWVHERLFTPTDSPWSERTAPDLSPFELLSFAAAVTERIRIGTSVLTIGYHRPVMLAKTSATLDVLSEGRLNLGIGLGLSKDDYIQSDVDFHTRGKRSADFIKALKACWMPDPVEYKGDFFDIQPSVTSPKPVQRDADGNPAIPLIGGFSSAPGQRRTAELCDAWQTAGKDLATAVAQYEIANAAATEEFGRPTLPFFWRIFCIPPFSNREPPAQIGDRVVPVWSGSIEGMVERVIEAREAGVDEIILDANRFVGDDKDYWERHPETFAPLVAAAHG